MNENTNFKWKLSTFWKKFFGRFNLFLKSNKCKIQKRKYKFQVLGENFQFFEKSFLWDLTYFWNKINAKFKNENTNFKWKLSTFWKKFFGIFNLFLKSNKCKIFEREYKLQVLGVNFQLFEKSVLGDVTYFWTQINAKFKNENTNFRWKLSNFWKKFFGRFNLFLKSNKCKIQKRE